MSFQIGFIGAKTHTPEYLMHKYWARKPHNVISHCIQRLLPHKGVIIDPFCGSGVTLREGALLGHECYGFDVNPTACLITENLLFPPNFDDFISAYRKIYNSVYDRCGYLYRASDGDEIKYISHRIIAKCKCGETVRVSDCTPVKKKLICPFCGNAVHFNLESLIDTEIFNVVYTKKGSSVVADTEILEQKTLSETIIDPQKNSLFNYRFPVNKRILAFAGIDTSSFFTNRNYSILCEFASEIESVEDTAVKGCLQLLLTASVAQCSRLIAHRNNLKTGGPAWSVPGFWVPCEHLETNPFIHITSRYEKFVRALKELEEHPIIGSAKVTQGDSMTLLETPEFKELKADLIFLDPPYGDNVPYTEFSGLWNSFLRMQPNYDDDISVSDRLEKGKSWSNYADKLTRFMELFASRLNEDGKLLITFNNNDMRAWTALLSSLQDNGFVCTSVFYQIPAVISSKAQMSITTSYISDIYSVFVHDVEVKPSKNLSEVIQDIVKAANLRGGVLSISCADREFILSWIKHNTSHELLTEKQNIFNSVFVASDGKYILKENLRVPCVQLADIANEHLAKLVGRGPIDIMSAYKEVSASCFPYGVLEFCEFKDLLSEYVVKSNKILGLALPLLMD